MPHPSSVRAAALAAALAAAMAMLALSPVALPAQSAAADAAELPPDGWRIDVGHSEIGFRIRHFVTRVRGTFDRWTGVLVADPARLDEARVEVTIDAASIDTNHEKRDSDLRGPDFLDVARHPTITFRSTRVESGGESLRVHGDLTMRGVTRPVILDAELMGRTVDGGRERIAFEATTKIDRTRWGVTWNRALEGGGVMLGDEVEITLVVTGVRERR